MGDEKKSLQDNKIVCKFWGCIFLLLFPWLKILAVLKIELFLRYANRAVFDFDEWSFISVSAIAGSNVCWEFQTNLQWGEFLYEVAVQGCKRGKKVFLHRLLQYKIISEGGEYDRIAARVLEYITMYLILKICLVYLVVLYIITGFWLLKQ